MNKTATTAAKPKRAAATKTPAKPAGAKAGSGKGKTTGQKQDAAPAAGKQGEGTSGKPPVAAVAPKTPTAPKKPATPAVVLGGTAQVPIEVVAVSKKPYKPRARMAEKYPFGDERLTPAVKDKSGEIVGPSFFIPDSEKAAQRLAVARKRHKGILFWSRRRTEEVDGKPVTGLRIWRGTPGLDPK